MGRYEIILGKEKEVLKDVKSMDFSQPGHDCTAVSLTHAEKLYVIADSPDDVVVRCDFKVVDVESVNGSTGEVILKNIPQEVSHIEIFYTWNRTHCFQEKEIIDIVSTTSRSFQVSCIPMVKIKTQIETKNVNVVQVPNSLVDLNIEDIKAGKVDIVSGSVLSADAEGVLYVGEDNPIGIVDRVNDSSVTVNFNLSYGVPAVNPQDVQPDSSNSVMEFFK